MNFVVRVKSRHFIFIKIVKFVKKLDFNVFVW